jgi:hypothetical protein
VTTLGTTTSANRTIEFHEPISGLPVESTGVASDGELRTHRVSAASVGLLVYLIDGDGQRCLVDSGPCPFPVGDPTICPVTSMACEPVNVDPGSLGALVDR